jgi:hypothetical protein
LKKASNTKFSADTLSCFEVRDQAGLVCVIADYSLDKAQEHLAKFINMEPQRIYDAR